MKTIIYTDSLNDFGQKLINITREKIKATEAQVCNSVRELSNFLCRPLNKISVVILLINSDDELIQFISMNKLFDNIKVILILPDRNPQTLALALKFKTSFISYLDNDLQDVISVLEKIFSKRRI